MSDRANTTQTKTATAHSMSNRMLSSKVPPIVQEVLNSPGRPLDPNIRAFMEPRFDHDFSRVRVHSDARAAASTRALGALAFARANHVVIRNDAISGSLRLPIFAHELAHVVQHRSAGTKSDLIVPASSPLEVAAATAADAVLDRGFTDTPGSSNLASICLYRDTRLDDFLLRLEQAAPAIREAATDDERVQQIIRLFSGVDLTDLDNLGPVSDAVSRLFPEQTLFMFLNLTESDARVRDTDVSELRMRRTVRLGQVSQRPWGGYGPFPVTELWGRAAEQVIRGGSRSIAAFFEGVIEGSGGRLSSEVRQSLRRRMVESSILNVVFPGVFAAGAVAGIGIQLWRALEGIWQLITNFVGMIDQFRQLFQLLVSPTGPALSRVFGRHVGQEWGAEIARMAGSNIFQFTFALGRIVGPAVVYAVLAILGIGIGGIAARASAGLIDLLRRVPILMRLVDSIGGFFRGLRIGLRTRQRFFHLERDADGLEAQALELESRAAGSSVQARRAERMRQRAEHLRREAAGLREEANQLRRGERSAVEELPSAEQIEAAFERGEVEAEGFFQVGLGASERNPAELLRLTRRLMLSRSGNRVVFRVEAGGSRELIRVGTDGGVTISRTTIDLNFGSAERAVEFLQDHRGSGARIVIFEVDDEWVRALRSAAIPEHGTGSLGRQPRLVDVRFAEDQMQIPGTLVPELENFVVPRSGRVLEGIGDLTPEEAVARVRAVAGGTAEE